MVNAPCCVHVQGLVLCGPENGWEKLRQHPPEHHVGVGDGQETPLAVGHRSRMRARRLGAHFQDAVAKKKARATAYVG